MGGATEKADKRQTMMQIPHGSVKTPDVDMQSAL
jgi:hypothetical protein